jgi:hypothetical protein
MLTLANFLVSEVRNIESNSSSAAAGTGTKKGVSGSTARESKEAIPSDKIRDAPALARELRWRVRLALGGDSGDEGSKSHPKQAASSKIATSSSQGVKRKRPSPAGDDSETVNGDAQGSGPPQQMQKFRHFKPRAWDAERRLPTVRGTVERQVPGKVCKFEEDVKTNGGVESGGYWLDWHGDASGNSSASSSGNGSEDGTKAETGDAIQVDPLSNTNADPDHPSPSQDPPQPNQDENTATSDSITAKAEWTTETVIRFHRYEKDGKKFVERQKSTVVKEIWQLPQESG